MNKILSVLLITVLLILSIALVSCQEEDEGPNCGAGHTFVDEVVESTFHPNAKQQIIDKYRYPVCMEYLQAFEEALATVAPTRGASGIKVIGSNNKAIQYKIEVKIKGHDDRLFSSQNNYIFDIFSPKGMH